MGLYFYAASRNEMRDFWLRNGFDSSFNGGDALQYHFRIDNKVTSALT
jgi:hypothetical protein